MDGLTGGVTPSVGGPTPFAALADLAPALIWLADAAGARTFANRGWTAFTGTAGPGDGWTEALHPDDRPGYLQGYRRDVAAGRGWRREFRLRRSDGAFHWMLENASPIGDGSGFVASCVDVNARYRESERQSLLARVGAELDAAPDIDTGLGRLARLLVDLGFADRCTVRVVGADGVPQQVATAASDPHDAAGTAPDGGGLSLPLRARGAVRGVLAMARWTAAVGYDDGDVALLEEVAARAGMALDNALLLADERATAQRLELLQRATAELSAAATPEQVVEVTRRHVARLLGTPAVGVWELEEADPPAAGVLRAGAMEGWDPVVVRDWAAVPFDGASPLADAAREHRAVQLERGSDWDREYPHLGDLVAASGYRGLAVWPLVVAGESLGALAVGFERPRALGASERATAVALAEQCAQAVARARLLRAERAGRRAAVQLGTALAALSGATDLAGVTRVVLDQVTALGASSAVIALRAEEHLDVLAAAGLGDRVPDRLPRHGVVAVALDRGEPVWAAPPAPSWGSPAGEAAPLQAAVPLLVAGGCIGVLGLSWESGGPGRDERPMLVTLAGQCAQALDRARLQQAEHEVAQTLQRVLLPPSSPQLDGLAVATRYLPGAAGTEAGGDWYDVIPLADGRVAIVVGDVVGQGPRAAAVMGQLRSALAAYLLDDHGPAEALERLDRFARRVQGAAASTVACMVLDRASGELCWSRAGHVPALVLGDRCDDAGVRMLADGSGTVLGVSRRPPFTEEHAVLTPGSCVLLYTDGLVERRGENIDDGLDRLAASAAALRDRDPERLATALLERCLGTGAGARDDVALVVIRLLPAPLERSVPADPKELAGVRREVREWARQAGLEPDLTDDLQLALGEAVTNAVEHAYRGREPGVVGYRLAAGPAGAVEVEVRDEGRWRPPPEDSGHRGRGLFVIDRLAQGYALEGSDGGTVVRFAVHPDADAAPAEPSARPPAPARQAARIVQRTTETGAAHLHLSGQLDLIGAGVVRDVLLAAVATGAAAVVDVTAVDHVSSAGVGLLMEAGNVAAGRGGRLEIRTEPGTAADRILRITGLVR
jgi:anti-anti-sigma factor